jgi:hypothetical protein
LLPLPLLQLLQPPMLLLQPPAPQRPRQLHGLLQHRLKPVSQLPLALLWLLQLVLV